MADQPVAPSDLPEAYRLILSQAEDISRMTVVPYRQQELELVPRIHGWKPIPAARIVSASEKRKAKDCPLCQADERAHSLVWHAYGVKKQVEEAVKAAHDAGLAGVSAQLVRRHFPNHNYTQPAPLTRPSREEMLRTVESINDRGKRILLAVYRQRSLSTKQIVQLFFEPETSSDESAQKSAYRLLHELRFKHLLYPFRVEDRKSPEVFYSLGRWAVPFVEDHEGVVSGTASVSRREDVKEYQLEHDLRAADMFVQLRRQLYTNRSKDNLVEVDRQRLSLRLPTECWWGARSLRMGYRAGGDKIIEPDGFGALQFNDGRKRQFLLPFFLEWDSGHKTAEDTAEQLVNYLLFSSDEAAGKRFPQLRVDGYRVPVLMATSTPARALRLSQMVRELMSARGLSIDEAPLVLITDAETMLSSGWARGAWRNVLQDDLVPQTLAEQLLAGSSALIEQSPIHWRLPITIDLTAAVPAAAKLPGFLRSSS